MKKQMHQHWLCFITPTGPESQTVPTPCFLAHTQRKIDIESQDGLGLKGIKNHLVRVDTYSGWN